MTWAYVAVGGGMIISSLISSNSAKNAAKSAAGAQTDAAQAGIDVQKDQFEQIKQLLAPYVGGGEAAFGAQGNLIGLGGDQAQQSAIANIQNGPEFAALTKQGENSILQNASATGGLRGGNTQAALAQFRPQLLAQLINQRFGQLGSLSQQGLAAGSAEAGFGSKISDNITNLMGQQGAAQAGSAIAQGKANQSLIGGILGGIGTGLGGLF